MSWCWLFNTCSPRAFPTVRLKLLCKVELIARGLKLSKGRMPTGPRIFVSATLATGRQKTPTLKWPWVRFCLMQGWINIQAKASRYSCRMFDQPKPSRHQEFSFLPYMGLDLWAAPTFKWPCATFRLCGTTDKYKQRTTHSDVTIVILTLTIQWRRQCSLALTWHRKSLSSTSQEIVTALFQTS